MLKSEEYASKVISMSELSYELDCLLMDVAAVKSIANDVCELCVPVSTPECDREDDRNLHGGLERALWRILDSLTEDIRILSEAAFNATCGPVKGA